MPLRQAGLPEGGKHPIRVPQDPQLVGHSTLAFSQQPGNLLLGHVVLLQQPPDAHGFLNEVQVLPL